MCSTPKELTQFNKQSKSRDGRNSYCRECSGKKIAEWRDNNREHRQEYRRQYNRDNAVLVAARTKRWRDNNKDKVVIARQKFYKHNPERNLIYEAKKRARDRGVPFAITYKDIVIPDVCPILGIKLERNGMNNRDSSPSLDCIIPKLGYIPGNIAVMSYRANRIKNDASLEELEKVTQWLRAHVADET